MSLFSKYLKYLREKVYKLKKVDFAKAFEVTRGYYGDIEKGRFIPPFERLEVFSKNIKLDKDIASILRKLAAEGRAPEEAEVILNSIVSPITGEVPSIASYPTKNKRRLWAKENKINPEIEIPISYSGTSWAKIVLGNHLIQESVEPKMRLIVFPPSPGFTKLTVLKDGDLAVVRFSKVGDHNKIFAAGKCHCVFDNIENSIDELQTKEIRPKYLEFRCDKENRSDLVQAILDDRDKVPASKDYDQDLTIKLNEYDHPLGKIALAMKVKVFQEPE